MDILENKHLRLKARERLFEFMDLTDGLLKSEKLKIKLESTAGISNHTLWLISHRREQRLPPHFFLNRFWTKFFHIIFKSFELLDDENSSRNFGRLEMRYRQMPDLSLEFYLIILCIWLTCRHKSYDPYSCLLSKREWLHLWNSSYCDVLIQNLSGKRSSGSGASGEA